jgi:hypothetical protein
VFLQGLPDVLRLVVDSGVEAEISHEIAAFLRPSRDAHDMTAFDFCYLSHDGSYATSGARNGDSLAQLRLTDIEQAEIGGQAWHPKCAEIDWQRRKRRVNLREAGAIGQRILLYAQQSINMVANPKLDVLRSDNTTQSECPHYFPNANRWNVGLSLVHPAAHCGI